VGDGVEGIYDGRAVGTATVVGEGDGDTDVGDTLGPILGSSDVLFTIR
jgi:hypothetical protein